MPLDFPLAEIRSAIEAAAAALFSEGALSEKTDQALRLAQLPGLDLYSTAVPWRIILPRAGPVVGFSETLRSAARDIHSNLATLGKEFPPTTLVALRIDRERLPKPR